MGCPLSFLLRAWVNFAGCFFEEVNPGNKDEANKWSKDFNANICRSNFFFFTLDGSPSLIYNFGDKLTANILAQLFAILLAALATTFFTDWFSPPSVLLLSSQIMVAFSSRSTWRDLNVQNATWLGMIYNGPKSIWERHFHRVPMRKLAKKQTRPHRFEGELFVADSRLPCGLGTISPPLSIF